MTSLAYSDSRWRRRGGGASGPRRPCLFREIRRCAPQFLLRQGLCHPRHDLVVSISTLEVMQLFQEVIFRLTPDERNGCISAHDVHAVAFVAHAQLGVEFSIRARIWDGLGGNCRRSQEDQNAENNLCTQEFPLSLACCRRIIAHKSGWRACAKQRKVSPSTSGRRLQVRSTPTAAITELLRRERPTHRTLWSGPRDLLALPVDQRELAGLAKHLNPTQPRDHLVPSRSG